MKRVLIVIVLLSTFISCFSQNSRLGFNVGGTLSFIKSKYDGRPEIIKSMKPGVNAGVTGNIPFAEKWCFIPSLNFTQKGGNYRYQYNAYSFDGSRTLNYIELLLNVGYSVPVPKAKLFIGLGPGVSYGISGKYKDEITSGGQTIVEGDIKFGNDGDEDDYKPLDLGGNIMAGCEFSSGFFMAVNYYLGLSNLEINDHNGNFAKNRYFGLRFGYFIPHKK